MKKIIWHLTEYVYRREIISQLRFLKKNLVDIYFNMIGIEGVNDYIDI